MTKKQILLKETIYFAGGCLWGVQEFLKHLPGVVETQAGRANGATKSTKTAYDGYAECVKTVFDAKVVSIEDLIHYFLEIIDPYSINQQGNDIGEKYRTGIYSEHQNHLLKAKNCIDKIEQKLNLQNKTTKKIAIEILPLTNYIPSDAEHQDRLTLHPNDHSYCHIPLDLLHKYKKNNN
ncbi:peptide-methionine (S)-S-oxide reductase [Lutibacter sp. HS1-25]|uniref:peptide-methionine (S)-S-oxide reductase n=1 Tax=Lutibacter sp. HS1-25 TaxID=2485000 RepID=UPI00101324B4|nr:peptide-methionine (S)-S-oxide reductase [Lutibacter sp. HS1-25]RXP60894.1 peptide-methionine (S)-S-oxide reductase [Lutibacter sp. HS1-25]